MSNNLFSELGKVSKKDEQVAKKAIKFAQKYKVQAPFFSPTEGRLFNTFTGAEYKTAQEAIAAGIMKDLSNCQMIKARFESSLKTRIKEFYTRLIANPKTLLISLLCCIGIIYFGIKIYQAVKPQTYEQKKLHCLELGSNLRYIQCLNLINK